MKAQTKFNNKHKIKKEDLVMVMVGNDKGKVGKVMCVKKTSNTVKVVVQGCAIATKHVKPTSNQQGHIIEKERCIDISNVAFYDAKHSCCTKIGYRFVDGVKYRFAKASDELIINSNK